MVKLSQHCLNTKNRKKCSECHLPRLGTKIYTTGGILRGGGCAPLEAGFEGAQPLATFWLNLCGFRVPGNDILALDEVQTVFSYTHMVITRFLYRSAGLNELQSVAQSMPRSQQFSGFSSEDDSCPDSDGLFVMPSNVDPSVKKGVGLKQLAYCML